MPDLFQPQENLIRDKRFGDTKTIDPTATSFPLPVEPFIAKDATIPTAPMLRKPKYTQMHIFTSYCELPPNITFENQEAGEKILLFIRRSFITNINWIILSFVLMLLPVAISLFLPHITLQIPNKYMVVAFLFYLLLVATYFFVNFITWYFNIILITDTRIVDIDFEELVYKNVAETKIDLVQDVSYTQTGVIRTIADYGDVLIQTAGTKDNFDWHAIPRPERVVNIVEDLIGNGRGLPNV